ncbi:LysR family transcriptional regulator [Pseudidiomarina sp.]|uniref:LysR family transcriptional regulator n=1 Tax=Pseudidiomarina sp. TaxID=2081707 RepID=UPI00299EDFB6|nr:LysR family transcriptional regulator [Pseudidiomarina sp.]MDX1706501.1 LysR family transcriptional regulator [Pseudidiomarina sp.]
MRTKSPSLNALRVFSVAAHAASFKQAAQQLGVSQSAVTRQVQALEEQLGTRLFQRDNRVHALTPAGQALAPELQRIFRELERTVERTRDIGDSELTTLRLAVPESFLRWWLSVRLADFYALYPHIRLHFSTVALFPDSTERSLLSSALQHEGLDLAIHYGGLRDKSIRQQSLYTPVYIPVAAKTEAAQLDERNWLIDPQSAAWQQFSKVQARLSKRVAILPVSNSNIAIDLIQGTAQITLLDRLFLQHPELTSYQQFTEHQVSLPETVQLSVKSRQRQPVAVVAFSKWLESRLQASLR